LDFVYAKSIPLPAAAIVDKININISINLDEIIFLHSNIKKNLTECFDIERRTIMQNDDFWKKQRLLRVTSSNFHAVCKSTNLQNTSMKLLNPPDLCHVPAVSYGKKMKGLLKT
jgi:hypothetical protein